ncbi:MAG: Mg-dependent DNase [Candidatus Bathyarchaeota archaeon B63]|nr:MAG: Mg-dependent DNase [Candidatus Bathyarchaeota archaeon B63]
MPYLAVKGSIIRVGRRHICEGPAGLIMELIDTHAHLEDVKDLAEAIRRAGEAGVKAIITMGSDSESNAWALSESSDYQTENVRIYPALGIHPWSIRESKIEKDVEFIERNIHKAVAVGEIGLDYWYRGLSRNPQKKELQRTLFRRLLKIAKENGKPVSIHSRGAWMDCVEITAEMNVKKAVFHWFSGPEEALRKILENGYYISATPAAEYSKWQRAAIRSTPLENIILETDSPVSYRGEPAEPMHILRSLSAVAELKSESERRVAEKTTENARRIFGI